MTRATWSDPLSDWTATAGGATAIGGYRETNQDRLVLDPARPLALVLDGMGGSPAGEQAAALGGDALVLALARGPAIGEAVEAHLRQALRSAGDAVRSLHADPEARGAGATVVLALLHAGRVFVAWAGDSLAYRVSDGRVEPLTWAHDFRTICCRRYGLSEAEAREYRWKNVLVHYLGGELPDPVEVPAFARAAGTD